MLLQMFDTERNQSILPASEIVKTTINWCNLTKQSDDLDDYDLYRPKSRRNLEGNHIQYWVVIHNPRRKSIELQFESDIHA